MLTMLALIIDGNKCGEHHVTLRSSIQFGYLPDFVYKAELR